MGRMSTPKPAEQGPVRQFDIAIRGYDKRQVDGRLAYLTAELRGAEAALRRADQTEAELRQLRQQVSTQTESSFGFRVDKILRLAEEEAKEAREQAKAEADLHRRTVEREMAERTAAMEEQEHELAGKRASIERQLQTMRAQAERDQAQTLLKEWRIKAAGTDVLPDSLSGGNQQKVVIGKWLATQPKVIILDEPTKGIDIGSKAAVHAFMGELAAAGLAVLMVSSEIPEILGMADRVLVMEHGRIVEDGPPDELIAGTGRFADLHRAWRDSLA